MCIRDRVLVDDGSADQSWTEIKRLKSIYPAIHGVRLHKNCLLYTSDAADERSSVDLGGRRIIKKKNKVKT